MRVLIAAAAPSLRRALEASAAAAGARVRAVAPGDLWEGLARNAWDLLVIDRALLPEPVEPVVGVLRSLPARPQVLLLDGGDEREALSRLDAAIEARHSQPDDEAPSGTGRPGGRPSLDEDASSVSAPMREMLELARRVAASDSSLLILGETGVGKEWLARAIHFEGPRAAGPFVAVNCAAVPDTLLESELFGHERGAFTGAVRTRRGYFEQAHGGTLFLDEVADMSTHLQAKLLRALHDHIVQRLGSEKAVRIDARVIAATNRDLGEAMGANAFRRDLYYRLGTVTLTLPPLRERREDIPGLVELYLGTFRRQISRSICSLDSEALDALERYAWPGNVRELINVVERAVLLCSGDTITLRDLPAAISGPSLVPPAAAGERPETWLEAPLKAVRREAVARVERRYLEEQLRRTGGRIGEAARRAGMTPRALYDKMRRYNLRKEEFRSSDP